MVETPQELQRELAARIGKYESKRNAALSQGIRLSPVRSLCGSVDMMFRSHEMALMMIAGRDLPPHLQQAEHTIDQSKREIFFEGRPQIGFEVQPAVVRAEPRQTAVAEAIEAHTDLWETEWKFLSEDFDKIAYPPYWELSSWRELLAVSGASSKDDLLGGALPAGQARMFYNQVAGPALWLASEQLAKLGLSDTELAREIHGRQLLAHLERREFEGLRDPSDQYVSPIFKVGAFASGPRRSGGSPDWRRTIADDLDALLAMDRDFIADLFERAGHDSPGLSKILDGDDGVRGWAGALLALIRRPVELTRRADREVLDDFGLEFGALTTGR